MDLRPAATVVPSVGEGRFAPCQILNPAGMNGGGHAIRWTIGTTFHGDHLQFIGWLAARFLYLRRPIFWVRVPRYPTVITLYWHLIIEDYLVLPFSRETHPYLCPPYEWF